SPSWQRGGRGRRYSIRPGGEAWLTRGMLDGPQRLSPDALDAVAQLEREGVSTDGGRLKLEWPTLKSGDRVDPLLWWEEERLVGFIGLYVFTPDVIELAGMVAPGWRRRGVGTALL